MEGHEEGLYTLAEALEKLDLTEIDVEKILAIAEEIELE